jgi:hypothetical protein
LSVWAAGSRKPAHALKEAKPLLDALRDCLRAKLGTEAVAVAAEPHRRQRPSRRTIAARFSPFGASPHPGAREGSSRHDAWPE